MTTYTQLIADIQSYVDNDIDELANNLPKVVARGHARIQRDLELAQWRARLETSLPYDQERVDRPSGALKIYSIFDEQSGRFVERRATDYVRAYGGRGRPRYFAEDDEDTLFLAPRPDGNRHVTITYLKRLDPPSVTTATTWISENLPEMLFYACLAGAEEFLIGQERKAEFEAEYARALNEYRNELRGLHNEEYAPIRQAAIVRGLT